MQKKEEHDSLCLSCGAGENADDGGDGSDSSSGVYHELDEEIRTLTKQASQKTYIGGLTKECVDAFVSMVYLYDDQTMKVEFNCEDVIRRALEKYGA